MFWLAQSVDLNPIELVWDELTEKSELSNPQKQLTSGNLLGKTIFSQLLVLGGKNGKIL